jgi:transcriptional regulator with XRE-family HTH domain
MVSNRKKRPKYYAQKDKERYLRNRNPDPGSLKVWLGALITEKRIEKDLSQKELALIAGFSLKYLGDIERGFGNFSSDTYEKIFKALHWHPREITKEAVALKQQTVAALETLKNEIAATGLRAEDILKFMQAPLQNIPLSAPLQIRRRPRRAEK